MQGWGSTALRGHIRPAGHTSHSEAYAAPTRLMTKPGLHVIGAVVPGDDNKDNTSAGNNLSNIYMYKKRIWNKLQSIFKKHKLVRNIFTLFLEFHNNNSFM